MFREIRIVVDSEEGAKAIDDAVEASGLEGRILTLIDLNVGLNR